MGIISNNLVTQAVLWKNPGVTREEFADLLDKTHSSALKERMSGEALTHYDPSQEDAVFHKGLEGVAELLSIHYSQNYKEFTNPSTPELDANGQKVSPPIMYSLGDIILEKGRYIVHHQGAEEYFKTREDLLSSWPQYDTNNVYDWDQEGGHFRGDSLFGGDSFLWRKEGERYYLDERTFDIIPAGINSGKFRMEEIGLRELGYTDLVLTSEAIKHGAWVVLSGRRKNQSLYLQEFFETFPDSREVYERAVWDSHTSLSAKMRGLSVSDFLRSRVPG